MTAGTTSRGVVIEDLSMSFDILRTRDISANTAKFKVYNVTEDTSNKMLKAGNSIIFKAGYEDEGLGLLYVGQITQSIPTRTPPDNVVDIECSSGQGGAEALKSVTVALSYKKGTSVSRPLKEIGTALGLSLEGVALANGAVLANGLNMAGTAKQMLRHLQMILDRNDLGLFVDNARLIVFNKFQTTTTTAVHVSLNTGLISAPKLTDNKTEGSEEGLQFNKRVLFRTLLNYKITPNGLVYIDYEGVTGTYTVDRCTFKGDNFGGSFYVDVEALGESSEAVEARVNRRTKPLLEF